MADLFDGTESASSYPDSTPDHEPGFDAPALSVTEIVDQLGAWVSPIMAVITAAGYFWIGFPLTLLLQAAGFPIIAPQTAMDLYTVMFGLMVGVTLVADALRRIKARMGK